jgi:peptidoglycan/xylan/chitin deacetylase (PgdA/CDA1 family)
MRNIPSALALLSGLAIAFLLVAGPLIHSQELALAAPLSTPAPVLALEAAIDIAPSAPPTGAINTPRVATVATATPVARRLDGAATAVAAPATKVRPTPGGSDFISGRPTATPVSLGRPHQLGTVPILMYHYVRINPIATDTTGFNLSVTPDNFRLQMRFLEKHGYSPVSVADVREYVINKTPLPAKPIANTFDDGYGDAYMDALPTLERFHLTATFYVVTGFVGRPNYLTWEQVATLESHGMEIASHTVHHRDLTVLGALKRQAELADSRAELERRLGHVVLDFCYPGGQIDVSSELAVARAGYVSATTTAYGRADIGDDPLRLPRLRVWGGESLATFAELVGEAPISADYGPIDNPG